MIFYLHVTVSNAKVSLDEEVREFDAIKNKNEQDTVVLVASLLSSEKAMQIIPSTLIFRHIKDQLQKKNNKFRKN